ncbi:MAG TPA: PD-(D/E)XK nuclease family protein [Salinivirgaceae bacterium]|nr:PD-(D/E)XK nuclease family protein [Salinivirgaceae bacterium]
MAQFLKLVAQDIYNKFKNNLEDKIVVLPSKRPEYYLYRYLSQISPNEILAPKVTTLNELVENWSNLITVSNLELVYHLYIVYKKHLPGSETFDDFYFWGEVILSDFNDIDKALANPEEIFTLIENIKQIEEIFDDKELASTIERFWKTFYSDENTKIKERFLKFWKKLLPIYKDYNKYLIDRKIAYHGNSIKNALDNLNSGNVILPDTDFIFVGFDYLTNAEKAILQFIKNNGKAHFYWDYDELYLDKKYEAGYHIRENLKLFPSNLDKSNFNNFSKSKSVDIQETPGMSSVAQLAIDNATEKHLSDNSNPDFTAIVLADTNILQPMLSKLPKYNGINITTGWQVKYSSSAAFASIFLNLWRQQTNSKNQGRFSVELLLSLANSKGITDNDSTSITEKCKGKIFVDVDEFQSSAWLHKSLLIENETVPSKLSNILKNYIAVFKESYNRETPQNTFDIESAQHIITHLNQFSNVIKSCDLQLDTNIQTKLIERLINNLSVPFEGSPVSGIQITSISETKCLDFENVIIAGANEGALPSTSRQISHIPYSIRKSYGLTTFEDNVNITAYHVYRLMQRSKNITFIVNTDEQEIEKTDSTRFLQQFIAEQMWDFKPKKTYGFQIVSKLPQPISYTWDEKVSAYMEDIQVKGLSPTVINTYIDCPLKFYFKYPCKLNEPIVIENVIDNRVFGDLLHKAIEDLYRNFVGKTISAKQFNNLSNSIVKERVVKVAATVEEFNIHSGYNKLLQQIVIEYITQIIEIDKLSAPIQIINLEKDEKSFFQIYEEEKTKQILLRGNIDRIDKVGSKTRILDYKTGNPDINIADDLTNLFDNTKTKRNREALQTFIYAMLYSSSPNAPTPDDIKMGLIISRKITDNNFSFFHPNGCPNSHILLSDIIEPFKENLKTVLENMFNKENYFEQTENNNTCMYCPYKQICQR